MTAKNSGLPALGSSYLTQTTFSTILGIRAYPGPHRTQATGRVGPDDLLETPYSSLSTARKIIPSLQTHILKVKALCGSRGRRRS